MRFSRTAPVVAAALAWFAWAPAARAQDSRAVYAAAVDAVRKNDCPRALPLLEQYKALERARIERNPGFRAQLDRQIRDCRIQNILIMSGHLRRGQ